MTVSSEVRRWRWVWLITKAVCAVGTAWSATGVLAATEPMGATFGDEGTTFRVWAPYAASVAVIGEFNGWRPRSGDYLERDRRTGVWSGTIGGSRLRGGYQFLINDELKRRDPYGRAVTPDGAQSMFYDPADYRWRDIDPPRYALEELVIYELHIGTFHVPRPEDGRPATFEDATRKLDYLVELGVNTLCILPVHEFNGNHSWGYNPSDLFAVEQAYGGPDAFKRFVEACHERGLAVHLDIVHNHYGPENLDLLQFDGTGNPRNGGIYFYEGDGIGMTPWGPRVRFEQPMVRRFVRDNAMMWLEEYRVDGFRWDSTENIRAYNFGARPIPEGARMLEEINAEIKERFPGRWSIAEDSLNTGNFHASWEYDFHHQLMPAIAAPSDIERDMRRVAGALGRVPRRMGRVVYVDNHDEAGRLNGEQRIASDIDPHEPGSDYARRLSGIGAVLTFTAPGIPLLFMGNEFQEYGAWHDDTPLDWSKLRRHEGTYLLHRDLIALRKNVEGHSVGLKGLRIETPVIDDELKQLIYWREHADHPGDYVVVAINMGGSEEDLIIPFPAEGPWLMRLNSDWEAYGGAARRGDSKPFRLPSGAKAKTRMAPYSARIFTLQTRPGEQQAASSPSPVEPDDTPPERGPFSIWQSMYLTGNFNDWDPTAWPFEHVADHTWEGTFYFEQVEEPRFKITANDYDDIYWGRPPGRLEADESINVQSRRLGPEFAIRGTWDGLYRFRFNDSDRTLIIERIGDDPLPEDSEEEPVAEEKLPLRHWTNTRGDSVSARLLHAHFDVPVAKLEKADGSVIEVPIRALSRQDRMYIRDWILEREIKVPSQ